MDWKTINIDLDVPAQHCDMLPNLGYKGCSIALSEYCAYKAVVRYRQHAHHPWSYRCEEHAKPLDRKIITVETLFNS